MFPFSCATTEGSFSVPFMGNISYVDKSKNQNKINQCYPLDESVKRYPASGNQTKNNPAMYQMFWAKLMT